MAEVTVCRLDELPEVGARQFEVAGTTMAIVRIDDDVYALGASCTHQLVPLAEGEVDAETRHIECWKHGSSFNLVTGEPDALPATRPVAVYAARVEGASVVVEVP